MHGGCVIGQPQPVLRVEQHNVLDFFGVCCIIAHVPGRGLLTFQHPQRGTM